MPESSVAVEHQHPALAHHFEDLAQQKEAATLGMWVFLVTEVLFFSGLFCTYSVYRNWYPAGFEAASSELLVWAGTLNTAVLITSSLTMALAVHAAQLGNRRLLLTFLTVTILLGFVFLGVKSIEYYSEYQVGHVPGFGLPFRFDPEYYKAAQIFYSLYFVMTGLHAIHMIVGIGIMCVMWYWSYARIVDQTYSSPIEISGLYWHFVDIVWIFLFPLLYLLGRHLDRLH